MSMDKNYAQEKLALLLRDLDHYTGPEFWRQMSRIASGATGLQGAEEIARERDALAAHTERLGVVAADLANTVENDDELPIHKWAVRSARLIDQVRGVVVSTPAASLLYHDAAVKAEALETLYSQSQGSGIINRGSLIDEAMAYRKQAEGVTNVE